MPTQVVTIEFQADYSQLEKAADVLQKTGKVDAQVAAEFKKTNVEIAKQGREFEKTAAAANKETKSFKQLSDLMAQFPKSGLNRFLLQVGQELTKAGINADDFKKKLDPKDVTPKVASLRSELRQLREQMAQVALTSGVLSEEYQKLKARAGQLDDTIKDVSNDIANAGSDTRGIDNVVGSIAAMAGGFSAVQGAAALFGDESEELQKTLLKVNAAMAFSTGIQQVLNATTKQGSLTRLADTVATQGQIAVQKIYTFVTGRATAATVAFKVALAATGIGLVIAAIVVFANVLKSSTSELDKATDAVERHKASLESLNTLLDQQQSVQIAQAQLLGASESELIRIRARGVVQQIENLRETTRSLVEQRAELDPTSEAWHALNNAISANNETRRQLDTDLTVLSLQLSKQEADERKKAAEDATQKAKEAAEKARVAAAKERAAGFADFKAGVELELLAAEEGSRQQLELKKKLANAQLQIDLEAEGLTQNQRKLLIQKFFKERKDLEKQFNADLIAQATENEKNLLAATLTNLNLSEEVKLETKIDFLRLSASAEIAAAEGNASKIKLINAELNAAIAAAKVESIRKSAADEAALLEATGGTGRRALEAVATNERFKSEVRINAIRQLASIQTDAIDREIRANREANQVKGADNKALEIEYEQLLDRKAQATEEAEKRITSIQEAENKRRQDNNIAFIQATVAGLKELGNIAAEIAASNQQAAEESINRQRRELDDLVQAGAITEREAERRNKKIEAEERAAKNRAAQAQKRLAVFNAFLAIPQAFIAGLTAPFPIGGPIYGGILAGLAAIQAGIVASRPVPRFATGKKGSYSGPGIVGDAGAELIERADGSMHVAMKPELVYLGPKDKVFTAQETKQRMPFVNKEAIRGREPERMNYDKLAAAINKGQKVSGGTVVNIDKEFISESVANGLMRSRYFDRYYRSK
jgi:hypothetical protein